MGGRYHGGLDPGAQVESQNKGIKQIFRKIQPAFALRIVLKVPVPCASLLQFGRIVSQKQGRQPRIRVTAVNPGSSCNAGFNAPFS